MVAENPSYNTKTQIIQDFLQKGSGGGGRLEHPGWAFPLKSSESWPTLWARELYGCSGPHAWSNALLLLS